MKDISGPCVYMLRCRDNSLYTGWTNDFRHRLDAHRSGQGAKYTRSHLPVEPVYVELLEDKKAATKREAAIKKLTKQEKEGLISSPLNSLKELSGL